MVPLHVKRGKTMGLGSETDSDKNSKLQRYLCVVKNIKAYGFQIHTIFRQEYQLSKKYNAGFVRNVSFVSYETRVGLLHTNRSKKVNRLWTGLLKN
jgi:hypothetical protein